MSLEGWVGAAAEESPFKPPTGAPTWLAPKEEMGGRFPCAPLPQPGAAPGEQRGVAVQSCPPPRHNRLEPQRGENGTGC